MSTNKCKNQRDLLPIAIRAFVPKAKANSSPQKFRRSLQGPSEWAVIFDTETTTTPEQELRLGTYQVRKSSELIEAGIFYNPDTLSSEEQDILKQYASGKGLELITKEEFIENVFFGIGYDFRATIVGLNLPFDISRLAIHHNSARGKAMRGGFTFQLSINPWRPRVQIKHLSARNALIQFTKPRPRLDTRGMRKRGSMVPPRRGYFIDAKTLAAALTSRVFKLQGLADFLETDHRKSSNDKHGDGLTKEYIDYAVNDTQVTWECYRILLQKFEDHNLSQTLASKILSEASLGKAYLREMGIKPWQEMQPEFPDHLTGAIMSSYYGGRSEVRLRRTVTQVLYCDFLSMYPTVCTLMGLWRFVIAKGMSWRDNTSQISAFLKTVTLTDLQSPNIWQHLTTLVQVLPNDDILPVRAKYTHEAQATIGLNFLRSKKPLWFTLADCIASKILTGKSVKVLRAITFKPEEPQDGLKSIIVAGNIDLQINPVTNDFYKLLIDLRSRIKIKQKSADKSGAMKLDSEQFTLKIIANATSYGIFMELNVEELDKLEERTCFGSSDKSFPISISKGEEPGRYFHPLIATLITGAARLMLAMSERLAVDAGLDWVFCDTDSMALAKPETTDGNEFYKKAKSICDWFIPLNPYEKKGSIFKIEDANNSLNDEHELEPLFCFAVSSKRYVLFNLGIDGCPIIRKASAHGLGHFKSPYPEEDAPASIPAPSADLSKIGVKRWQYDLWHQIVLAALSGHPDQVDLKYHPALNQPAASRYAATTPDLLRWFKAYNRNRIYSDQVRPFNFMLSFQVDKLAWMMNENMNTDNSLKKDAKRKDHNTLKPIAPFNSDIAQASENCFDRETGELIQEDLLKTYRTALAQYHLSPESKFLNGEPNNQGPTQRRYVEAIAIHHIGKEATRWDQQQHLGLDEGQQNDYGAGPCGLKQFVTLLKAASKKHGQRKLADRLGISRMTLAKLLKGHISPRMRKRIGVFMDVIAGLKRE